MSAMDHSEPALLVEPRGSALLRAHLEKQIEVCGVASYKSRLSPQAGGILPVARWHAEGWASGLLRWPTDAQTVSRSVYECINAA